VKAPNIAVVLYTLSRQHFIPVIYRFASACVYYGCVEVNSQQRLAGVVVMELRKAAHCLAPVAVQVAAADCVDHSGSACCATQWVYWSLQCVYQQARAAMTSVAYDVCWRLLCRRGAHVFSRERGRYSCGHVGGRLLPSDIAPSMLVGRGVIVALVVTRLRIACGR